VSPAGSGGGVAAVGISLSAVRERAASVSAGLATRPIQGGRPTPYAVAVLEVVDRIPRGKVMSYGDVAEYVGTGSGRTVGAVMSRHGHEVPWHRVVGGTRPPHPPAPEEALRRLRRDRTPMRGDRVDMRLARWNGSER
jgi:methylated-DNA-protein-cysteine methyltransferase-like protein